VGGVRCSAPLTKKDGRMPPSPLYAHGEFDIPGFVTEVEDGRLWVFREGSQELKDFKASGEPAKQFTDIGNGPNGMTVKAADEQTLKDYLKAINKK
jgi:hypothetical protein